MEWNYIGLKHSAVGFLVFVAQRKNPRVSTSLVWHTLILAGGITPFTHTHTLSMYLAIKEDLLKATL